MKNVAFGKMIAAICLTVLFYTPQGAFGADATAPAPPANAAVVNGTPIPYADYLREIELVRKQMMAQGRPVPQEAGELNRLVVRDMVSRELVYQESVKKGIKIDDQRVEEEIGALKQRFGDQKQYEQWLASMKMDEQQLEEEVRQRQTIRMYIDKEIAPKVEVTEKETKAFYQDNQSSFHRPEEVHAQHILIKVEDDADAGKKEGARKSIMKLKKRLDAGEDFGELAKAHSQCPSADKNGDLGFFAKGRMVPAFEKAAFDLKPGQVSDVVETRFGFHLIKVLEHREAKTIAFEEVRDRISEGLRMRKINVEAQKYADGLREGAQIEVFVK